MEEEEREAQSAKLQELIRRGTPADLQEANHLMKIMAGYDQTSKTDYRAKAAEDIGKLGQKAKLLEEMLGRVKPGETIGQQDTFEDLASSLIVAQPKIQKMVEEESDDAEAVVKLLELNDVINTTLERYNLVKKGNLDAAKALPLTPARTVTTAAPASASSSAPVEDSLIDLGGDSNGQSAQSGPSGNNGSLQDDLLGLSIDDPNASIGAGGGIALGFGANSNIPGPPLLSSTLEANNANTVGQQQFPPVASSPSPQPDALASAFGNLASPKMPVSSRTPDPFATFGKPPAQPQALNNDDEEWSFSSALPPGSENPRPALAQNEMLVLDSNLRVVIDASRPATMPGGPIVLKAKFSNNAGQVLQDLTFQMAVTKTLALKMEPQTGRNLQPRQADGITQIIRVSGVAQGGGVGVKMRWKASYKIGNEPLTEEQGVIEGLPIP
jgi:ADP-ribosylation factor-binding protein GGA